MARPARAQFKDALYHVTNRGNGRQTIFADDADRLKFLEILAKVEQRYGIILYAFVLMPNHYHLLIETPQANLSRAIQRLNGDYALHFSRCHKKPGHVFQGRFKAIVAEKESYLLELSRYIHLNPYRARLGKNPLQHQWSSLSAYLSGKSSFPCTVHWEWILSMFGKTRTAAANRYRNFIQEGIDKKNTLPENAKGGWILGSERWVEKVLKRAGLNDPQELSGIKPLREKAPLKKMEEAVCAEFNVDVKTLFQAGYKNVPRQTAIYLAVDHCGRSLKEVSEHYRGGNYFAVGQMVSRFRRRLEEDEVLKKVTEGILSNVKM